MQTAPKHVVVNLLHFCVEQMCFVNLTLLLFFLTAADASAAANAFVLFGCCVCFQFTE